MASGVAHEIDACTIKVGKSTCGNGATERWESARMPAKATPIVRRVVATGRRIKISLKCIPKPEFRIRRLEEGLISADYTDYADYGLRRCRMLEQRKRLWRRRRRFFFPTSSGS